MDGSYFVHQGNLYWYRNGFLSLRLVGSFGSDDEAERNARRRIEQARQRRLGMLGFLIAEDTSEDAA